MYQVEKLSSDVQASVQDTARTIEVAWIITTQSVGIERAAAQYWLSRDNSQLMRYANQRRPFGIAASRLLNSSSNPAVLEKVELLLKYEEMLYRTLLQTKNEVSHRALPELELRLAEHATVILHAVIQQTTTDSVAIKERTDQANRLLLWQAIALIPFAILVASSFSIFISRSLSSLGLEIRRLGGGQFDNAIKVGGPRDIQNLGERLEWLRTRLQANELHKIRFVQNMSHELKTPLTSIREGIELLNDRIPGELSEAQLEVVEILQTNSLLLQKQLEDMLTLNMLRVQENSSTKGSFDLALLISDAIDNHAIGIKKKELKLITELESVRVSGESYQLATIIENLISNAIKFSMHYGTLKVTSRTIGDKAAVDIEDEGPGIDPAEISMIFEPFFKGSRQVTDTVGGSGLGLAIARYYAELHDGEIFVIESEVGTHIRLMLSAE
ncbi:MAG: HAMP domain-containing histidine kinase [Porticoccaceae bacterium]|nr:HAMP domain-containing histidine kinase [Porticoccaceae bacterium]